MRRAANGSAFRLLARELPIATPTSASLVTGSDEGLVRRWAHVLGFHPSPRRVVAAQWELPMDLTLQGSAYGGFGYAAASTTLHVVDQHDYH